jgi:hypothetical protein
MQSTKESLTKVKEQAEENMYGARYKDIKATLAEVRAAFEILKPMCARMNWLRIFFDGAKLFGRRLLITELVLLGLGAVLVPIIAFWLSGTEAYGFIRILKEPLVQRQVIMIVTVFVAPFLALAQTLWRLMQT